MSSCKQPATPLLIGRSKNNKRNLLNSLPILHPYGKFRTIWDIILTAVLVISITEIPFTLSFDIDLSLDKPAGIIALSLDIFLCINILINFRTAYFDEYDPLQLITSPKYIAKKYLKSRFLFDVLVSFPFVFVVSGPASRGIARSLQIFRILRVVRLLKVARIVKMITLFDKFKLPIYIKTSKVFFGMALCAHYFACLWWFVGKQMVDNGNNSWIKQLNIDLDIDLIDENIWIQYSYSYYWSIITLFTTGFGDITAKNVEECWVSVLCVVIGTVYISYLIGLIVSLVNDKDTAKQIERDALKNTLTFCEYYNLSNDLIHAVKSHIRYYHQYNYIPCNVEKDILNHLPYHLRKQMETEIAMRTLKDIDFLNECLSMQIIGQIAVKMKCISCNAGHFLYQKNDINAQNIYIQRTGISAVCDAKNNKYRKIKRGDIVGENCFISNKRQYSLKALTWSEFYVLNKNDIKDVISNNYSNEMEVNVIFENIKSKIKNGNIIRNIHLKSNKQNNKKHGINELSDKGQQLRNKKFDIKNVSSSNSNMSLTYSMDNHVSEAFNSLDAEMVSDDMYENKNRKRLDSSNRNKAILTHFRQNIFDDSKQNEMIETEQSPTQSLHLLNDVDKDELMVKQLSKNTVDKSIDINDVDKLWHD